MLRFLTAAILTMAASFAQAQARIIDSQPVGTSSPRQAAPVSNSGSQARAASAAEALANELGVELGVVRLDAVMSSYLGESASNLRRVFDFVEQERIVLLFDEFDSVGKERGDDSDHGELKRVVNAFLQMLDAYRGTSILLAATNHERLLDKALWRRFDEVVCFDKPNLEQVRRLLTIKTRAIRSDLPLSDTQFVNRFTGMSHSDIERVLVRAIKDMILKGREFLSKDLVTRALEREVDRRRQEE